MGANRKNRQKRFVIPVVIIGSGFFRLLLLITFGNSEHFPPPKNRVQICTRFFSYLKNTVVPTVAVMLAVAIPPAIQAVATAEGMLTTWPG
jgi:hypothetical protein